MGRIYFMLFLIVGTAICAASVAFASTVQDESLHGVSNVATSVVYNDPSFDAFRSLSCKMVGEKISLSSVPTVTTYFITTADACGWGAALGPIWLIRVSEGVASVLLSIGGYSVDVLGDERNGMRSVKIGSGTAGRTAFVLYRFDGKKYVLKKKRRVIKMCRVIYRSTSKHCALQ
ncbi:hypothetical protein [Trinickia dabaoshanensis]|uniref:hypothetical protein n=1 Tax=Trinickia dabaoshanensis TaxID=564714 RepID=UPI0011AF792C|nr:hypothetical protein [Trinickia dabaoshanensis]